MSIASELNNYRNGLDDAWDAAEDMGATIPTDRNMANLDQAIRTIPQSQGATYTAGNGINIDANNEISVDTSVVATQTDLAGKQDTLTAGSNMTISNNVISAKVDSALSASSTNPVQNSVVKAALDGFISEDDLYSEVCGSGTTITFQDAPDNAPLSDFKLKGETSQNGTPTPSAPVAVQTVTGENTVTISDGTNTQSYEVNLGKNLYDKSASTDGKRLDANGGEYSDSTFTLSAYIPVEPNTKYTLSGMPGSSYGHIATYDGSKTFVYRWYVGSDPYTFTTQANARYIRIATPLVCKDSTQCELGSQATSYAAYFAPIELCKIGDYQDYVYKDGGKWYVRKEVGKFTFPDSGWLFRTDLSVTDGSVFRYANYVAGEFATGSQGISSHFKVISSGNVLNTVRFIDSNSYGYNVCIANATVGITSSDSNSGKQKKFATWCSSNNPVCYYIKTTPTDTEITNEALVAQLEAILSQGQTYAGTNNITTVIAAGNEQGELEVCYTKTILPIATETSLGIVQIGSGLSITPNGVLSATGGGAAQNEPIVVWLDWDSVGTDLEILGTATGQFVDGYTSSATAVGSSFFAGALSDNKQVVIRTGGGLPVPGRDWARETLHPMQVNYEASNGATIYFWHETMFVRAQCPNSGTTWTFTKLSV